MIGNNYHEGDPESSSEPAVSFRSYLMKIMSLSLLMSLCSVVGLAQTPEMRREQPVICPAKFEDQHTRILHEHEEMFRARTSERVQTATLEVTFGPGAQANPDARAAFQFALDIWSTEIVSSVPIKIFADFANLGPGVLASAGPSFSVRNFSPDAIPDVFYPAALANSIAGEVLFPDEEFDLVVNLGNGINWYFGTDGNPPPGQFDFVTVALHEAGHGLGFTGIRSVSGGIGSIRSQGSYSIYSEFVVDGNGTLITTIPDPSAQLGALLTGGDLFMDGEFARAALGGDRPELFAPPTFQGGSSYAHWDEAAFPAGDPNSLMTPQVGSAEVIHDIGDITRGLFKDMGWQFNEAGAPRFTASPTSITEELFVDSVASQLLTISNVSDSTASFIIAQSPAVGWLSLDVDSGTLASATSQDITLTFDATGLTKGELTTTLLIDDFDTLTPVLEVPVTFLVLDGTEAPVISVAPVSLEETLPLLGSSQGTLQISNTGDADLDFDISLIASGLNAFEGMVAASNDKINTQGFERVRINSNAPANIGSEYLAILPQNGTVNKLATSLYATDFEGFTIGDLNGQQGWLSQFAGDFEISDANPQSGTTHLRSVSTGDGGSAGGNILALSPQVSQGTQSFMATSADIQITGTGTTWEFIPQSNTAALVNTRVRFNPDRSISVLDDAGFVDLAATAPEGYFNLRISVDRDNSLFTVFIDNEAIFTGVASAVDIEQVVILTPMENTGSTFDMDNVEITDGDDAVSFISLSPLTGRVAPGQTANIDVFWDARAVDATGVYEATATIFSNDAANPAVVVPATLNVVQPPTIGVSPDSISVAIDVTAQEPDTESRDIVVFNTGDTPLTFSSALGTTSFEESLRVDPAYKLAGIDMTNYGLGNTNPVEESSVPATKPERITEGTSGGGRPVPTLATFSDSIAYDTGIDFPDDFSGVQTAAYSAAVRFEVDRPTFNLTAVRNAYRTELVLDPVVILEIYRGGVTSPNDGELIFTETIETASQDGIFLLTELGTTLNFTEGEAFWVVHKYPDGVEFPQGVDDNATQRPNTYFFSGDGGTTFNGSGFVFLTRALSGGGSDSYISLSPASGEVAPGDSTIITATFDAAGLPNGTYNTPIVLSSNDPVTPTTSIPTTLEVSGQVSEISISDQLLDFGAVFVGGQGELSFTIFNDGLDDLNVSGISVDGLDFDLSASSAAIAANDSLVVDVTFAPVTLGTRFATVTITSDASNASELTLFVVGVGSAPPVLVADPEIVQATLQADSTGSASFTISNQGPFPLIFSLPELTLNAIFADENLVLNNTDRISFDAEESLMQNDRKLDDNRVGHQVLYSVGQDNGFGYRWIDSDEVGGPVYNFTDISATGTDVTAELDDEDFSLTALPFEFEFYGEIKEQIYISANGYVSFQEPPATSFINAQIPSTGGPQDLIAGVWDDLLVTDFNGQVDFQAFADRFVVQYTTVSRFLGSAAETVTFQIVLYPDGNIDIFYEDVETAPFITGATVGIENGDGTDGAQVAFNAPYLKDQLALRFVKPAFGLTDFITDANPKSGIIAPGGSVEITADLSAVGLADGVYFDIVNLSTNDPLNASFDELYELTVIGLPRIEVSADTVTFDPLFIGLEESQTITVSNTGTKTLDGILLLASGNADFSVAPDTVSIAPGESEAVSISFAPTVTGPIAGELQIVSNDVFGNDNLSVALLGEGVAPPILSVDPESISATLYEGEQTTETVTITNDGSADLTYAVTLPSFSTPVDSLGNNITYERLELVDPTRKEELDTRIGSPVLNASGGPGTFGYRWVDSNSGGAAFDFVDIKDIGTVAAVGADGDITTTLPFAFPYFGGEYNDVVIAANGFIAFEELPAASNFVNRQIPDALNPKLMIAGLWDDIEPQDGGGVFYYGTADQFIVQWEETPGFGFFTAPPAPVTFQIIIFPDGGIKLQYKNVQSTIATSSTIGLQGPEDDSGLQIIFNNTLVEDGLAISISAPITGTLAAGESASFNVPLDATDLEPGVYQESLLIASNDPQNAEFELPITLTVLDLPEVTSFTLVDARSDEDISPLREGDVIDLDDFSRNRFSIRANPGLADVGSVIFGFNGNDNFQTENVVPYALRGDRRGDYRPVTFPLGLNTVTATPFSERRGGGKEGIGLTVNFEVIRGSAGCQASEVVSYDPGTRNNGRPLPFIRSNPHNALGVAQENNTFNFVSLGFGGSITLKMACVVRDNPGPDLLLVETSFNDANRGCASYPEYARIEVSMDAMNWVVLGDSLCKDNMLDLADANVASAAYVRITDQSNSADFNGNADGFDVDGIMVISSADSTVAAARANLAADYATEANRVPDEASAFSMYPNPAPDNLITFYSDGLEAGNYALEILDLTGRIVIAEQIRHDGNVINRDIDISTLDNGLYLVRVLDKEQNMLFETKVLRQ